ncbi:KxYKxGKxW signal peptide domain-containing protein [Lentilactobacillus sp. IMAU92037]|uniref:MBG domain-containing protein n=1 Tax=Lentilactobacillus dabitei TaxID=2831523 RepID=UPI001C2C1723|nr:MBG domain-containing protein [Lentilactobacillus dabitei]MBV0931127.1 KxYKxGKxW signal peptide domain-containing protein [Lentilactobacillus dabitei]
MRRYQYDQITNTEPSVTRYKLYKAKKQWVVQGMTTVALLLGVHEAQVHGVPGLIAPDITTAHADTLTDQAEPTNDSPTTTTQNGQQDEQNNDQATSTPTATVATKTVVNTQDESETDQETVNNPATASTTTTNNNNAPQAVQATTGSVTPATSVNTESTNNEAAASQKTSKKNVTAVKATVQKVATPKVKRATDFNKQAAKMTAQAQKVADNVKAVVKADTQQANAKSDDNVVHDSGLDAIQAHVNSELKQVKATTSMKLPKNLAQMQTTLDQANEVLQSMRTELDVANKMLLEDKRGVNTQQVSDSEQALNKIVLPADTTAKIDEYGDLVVSTNNHASYQSVLNQMDSKGLTKVFRNVVDPVQLYYGISGYTDAELLTAAKTNIKSKLGSLDITQDVTTIKSLPFFAATNKTYYNSLAPYWRQLQKEYNSGNAADLMLAAAEYFGAVAAIGNISSTSMNANTDQEQSTDGTSFAIIINVDEYNNPIFTDNMGPKIKPGDLLNHAGVVIDPTNPANESGANLNNLLSPTEYSDTTYFTGKIGTEIANPTVKDTVPNFTYVSTDGPSKLSSILDGKTMQVVVNHWKSAVTALKAHVGDVSKVEDGTTTFKDVPTVTLSGEAGVKTPTFTADDFDWSKVQATPGSYSVTLNDKGISKITALNANTTLATTDVTAGQAIITTKTPTTVAIKAKVGDVTKVEDGTATFKAVPTVTLSGKSDLKTPTDFTADDFDWSKVQATPGSYAITLNDKGIAKVLALNANTTLATADITAGQATITAKTPTTVAIKAKVGDVTKVEDGTTTFKDVPTVTLSGKSDLKTPTDFTADDFDWSKVQATPGSYSITLNDKGIAKITALNANTTLATTDVTAGQATITAKTPTTVAIKAQVGDVTKVEDGTTAFKDVPTVTLSGKSDLKTPTNFTADDFDWSKVQATPGSYAITLNDKGIAKITAANANTTLATADITAGQATITAKTPTTVAIKAAVGDVTKVEDGTTTFENVPTVTLSGKSDLKTPTFTADDFDWSKVQATPGSYSVTLNAKGIAKILAANANTTLATADITAGQATITAKKLSKIS